MDGTALMPSLGGLAGVGLGVDPRKVAMTGPVVPAAMSTTRVDAIMYTLDRAQVAYELVKHQPVISTAPEAAAIQRLPDQVAKTVVLQGADGPVIAVIPASRQLDLPKLGELLGARRCLEFATEDQIARDFPLLHVSAIPPFGHGALTTVVVDRTLLENDQIVCPAGDHRYSVLVDPCDVMQITGALVAGICQD